MDSATAPCLSDRLQRTLKAVHAALGIHSLMNILLCRDATKETGGRGKNAANKFASEREGDCVPHSVWVCRWVDALVKGTSE